MECLEFSPKQEKFYTFLELGTIYSECRFIGPMWLKFEQCDFWYPLFQ
jgi:hypothetical protein